MKKRHSNLPAAVPPLRLPAKEAGPPAAAGSGQPDAEVRVCELKRLLRAARGINQLLVRARDPQPLLAEVCQLLVETRGYPLVWIGLAEPASPRVIPGASAGREAGYLDEIRVSQDESPAGHGPVGTAIRTGRPSLCQNTAEDPRFAPWREAALARGLAAVASVPLVQATRVFGALTVYSERIDAFHEEEVDLLNGMAGDLAFALQSIETQREHSEAQGQLRLVNAALESAANALAITDRAGVVTWVNPAFSRLTGYSLEELRGRKLNVLKSGAHDQAFYAHLWATILAGQVWQTEMVNRRKDGSLYSEENTITPVRDERGEITHFISVNQDITERKREHRRLAAFSALGERLGAARTAKEAAGIITDLADELLGWDLCFCRLYFQAQDQLTHLLGWDLINGRRVECNPVPEMLTPSALARRAIERGAQLILKDDPNAMHADSRPFGDVSRPSASILYAPIRHDSEVVGLISIQSYRPGAYDERSRETVQALADHCGGTLARIRAEEELRISGARFRSVWENSIDGMRLTDRVGRIVAVNEAYCRLVKLPREKLEGQLFSVAYEGQGPGEDLEVYQDRFDSGQITPSLATQVRLWNAEVLDLEISSSFIERGAHGKVLLGVFRNATERRRIEAQLRQSQKMEGIGQLAGGLAHDFNNLLAVINGNAELILQEGDSLSAPAREFLGHITGAAERAANLTRQLLIFSRKQAMQTQLVALNDLIGNLTRMLTRLIREDISLECAYAEPLPYVRADPGMIEQVLLNLVVNARDAMAQGGRLDIRTQEVRLEAADIRANSEAREGDFVCLRVADTGPGIPPEILPRIFEPFFSTKGIGKGTGLGLATVLGITQQHRGWVEVASTVGQGTTFSVFLPAVTDAALTPEKRAAESAPRGGTETILLVEDEPAVRMTTRRLLESKGYQVYAVASGQEAIEVWREHPGEIALLLTDIVMPGGVNGWELSERLCAQRPELRVIYLTGYSADVVGADTQLVRRTRSCLLHKPCSANRLLRIVRQCLDAA